MPAEGHRALGGASFAERGGETEFANSYAAYDALSDEEKRRYATLKVVHSLEASQRRGHTRSLSRTGGEVAGTSAPMSIRWCGPTPTAASRWCSVRSAEHVVGMDLDEGRALLAELLDRATPPTKVYRHHWSVGDTVIWDNRGVLHRAAPYDLDSPREMLRTTVLGDEPIK
ncbi:TauD/TfdA family dioxygenase [Mycolicibacterium vaccae]|nr:TauD/TfdA family dioxygenase [Mycolicibacterium vaccae]